MYDEGLLKGHCIWKIFISDNFTAIFFYILISFRLFFLLFQGDLIFPNGVQISAKKYQLLEAISTSPSNDRLFVNSAFFIFFAEKRIHKKIKKGLDRDAILKYLRDSDKFEILRSIYEHRVLTDTNGDVPARIRDFWQTFRVKFNNWWRSNIPKSTE